MICSAKCDYFEYCNSMPKYYGMQCPGIVPEANKQFYRASSPERSDLMIAAKYNKGARFNYKMPENAPYKGLADFDDGQPVRVLGLYINHKSKYGEAPVAMTQGVYVNLPKHLTDTVKDMLHDQEVIDAINDGKVGFTVYSYDNNGKTCYSVNWLDL